MKVLSVPNWSFGRNKALLGRMREAMKVHGVEIHFAASDPDHNRTVTAFSGDPVSVRRAITAQAEHVLRRVDLRTHQGVHPRVGALDVCPFVPYASMPVPDALEFAAGTAQHLAETFGYPVFLYEKSERGRHEADLPTLRKGGFEALAGRELKPDFGPSSAHERWGVSVVGVRDFLIAFNVNLHARDVAPARAIAREIRNLREDGDLRFLGVRALGFWLDSVNLAQVSLNVTLPDLTPIDPMIEHIARAAEAFGVTVADTELIGVIRVQDLPNATRLHPLPAQIVDLTSS